MTPIEEALRDAIIELAHMMVTHVDPRVVQALVVGLQALDLSDADPKE